MFAVRSSGLGKVVVQLATALSLCTAVAAAGVLTSMPGEGRPSQQVVAGASDNNWPSVPTVGTDNNWPSRPLGTEDNNWPKPLGTNDNNWPTKPLDAADNNWPTGSDDGTDNNWPKV
ncbi:hypothetical protein ACFYRY_32750 [Streptomyces sp. NPDC005263]|uniref:hypothetical protein n=1 Tax=Streptomyces sp. NPDC005263 TaxID=3364711 RepID=UPI003678AE50